MIAVQTIVNIVHLLQKCHLWDCFFFNHEQVMGIIEQRLNDDVWTETLVLEEADRVPRAGPAEPPEKVATKKPDKRKKAPKEQPPKQDSMKKLINSEWVPCGVYWRVRVNFFPT